MTKIFRLTLWQAMFLVLALLTILGAGVWLQRASFSATDVTLRAEGPGSLASGEQETFTFFLSNNSQARLEDVEIFVNLPPGITTPEGNKFITRRISGVRPQSETSFDLDFVGGALTQEEEEQGKIEARAEYSPQNLNARFSSSLEYAVQVGPLSAAVILDVPESAAGGQTITGSVHIVAEKEVSFSPLVVELKMPDDFSLSEANPPLDQEHRWRLGSIKPDEDTKLQFQGVLGGKKGEDKTFTIRAGRIDGTDFLPLKTINKSVAISESPLYLKQVPRAGDKIVSVGDDVVVDLEWRNDTDFSIENAVIEAEIEGPIINQSPSVLRWDRNNLPQLRLLEPGEGGRVGFSFSLPQELAPRNKEDTEQSIVSTARLRSPKQSLALRGVAFEADHSLELKINSSLSLSAESFSAGAAVYTVEWSLENTTNNLSSVRVEGVLPQGVEWKGQILSSEENIIYNSEARSIIWQMDNLPAGTGSLREARKASFPIGLGENFMGTKIMKIAKASAEDEFTGAFLEDFTPPLYTGE